MALRLQRAILAESTVSQGQRARRRAAIGFAAACAAVAASAVVWLHGRNATGTVVFTTAYGEKRSVTLPDSSEVTLNGNSRLSFDKPWRPAGTRRVRFEGEGYFVVRHTTAAAPFVVETSRGVSVGVLGTRFDLVARPSRTRVVLSEGRVRLDVPARPSVVLEAGELADVDSTLDRVARRRVDAEQYSAWRRDFLVLDDLTLAEIAALLRDTYGLVVTLADSSIARSRVSGIAPAADRESLLRGIAALHGLRAARVARDTVLLTSATSNARP